MSELDNIIHECIDSGMTEERSHLVCQQIANGNLRKRNIALEDEHVVRLIERAVGNVLQQAETDIESNDSDKTINGISPRELYDLLQDVYQLVDSVKLKRTTNAKNQAYDVGSSVDEIMSDLTAQNEIPTETDTEQTSDYPFSEGDIVRDKEQEFAEYVVTSVTEQDPWDTETPDGRSLSSFKQNYGYLDSDYVVKVETRNGDDWFLYPSERLELVEQHG